MSAECSTYVHQLLVTHNLMLPQPFVRSGPMLDGRLPATPKLAQRGTPSLPAASRPSAQPPVPCRYLPAGRAPPRTACLSAGGFAHARQAVHDSSRHERTRCAAAETATELVSATERFVEEFQAAERRTEDEQAGHLVSLAEQLQAVRLKVWLAIGFRRLKHCPGSD